MPNKQIKGLLGVMKTNIYIYLPLKKIIFVLGYLLRALIRTGFISHQQKNRSNMNFSKKIGNLELKRQGFFKHKNKTVSHFQWDVT